LSAAIEVSPASGGGWIVRAGAGRTFFLELEDAMEHARERAEEMGLRIVVKQPDAGGESQDNGAR
jgi:hypothetical protein